MFLNIDLGEMAGEPEELYAHAHVANIACGGHAGDAQSMTRAVALCRAHGTRIGAHPSFPDREGFGRRPLALAAATMRDVVAEQCAALAAAARAAGARVEFVKAHGALYHAARDDAELAEALLAGSTRALGSAVILIGPPDGALAAAAMRAHVSYAREGFADRAVRPDGTLVARTEPGALLLDPCAAADRARQLVRSGRVDTICVHGDTPGAATIARAVRAALDEPLAASSERGVLPARGPIALEPFGDAGWRLPLPAEANSRAVLDALRAVPGVEDVVVAEHHALLVFDPGAPPAGIREAVERALVDAPHAAAPRREHVVRARYDGPDLGETAARAGVTPRELIELHARGAYVVAAIGFLPGFAYLRGLDPRLAVARRPSPRARVPALSIGLAGPYTGVYPFSSSGGWNLIATAVDFTPFDGRAGALLALGDRVRFEAVALP